MTWRAPFLREEAEVFPAAVTLVQGSQWRLGVEQRWAGRAVGHVIFEAEGILLQSPGWGHCTVLGISVQFSSAAQSCPTLCDPMNRSTPGLPVHHQLPESTQTHVHRVSDAIQPSHLLSSPSPPAPNPSQHQSLGVK